jgi:hypothetical protein
VVNAKVLEYSNEDGVHIKHILESPVENLASAIGDFRPKTTLNGNYLAEVCVSQDEAFAAVLLLQFSELNYVPVTDALFFEGNEASLVAKLFK